MRSMDKNHNGGIGEVEFMNYVASKMAEEKFQSSDDLYRSEQGDFVREVVRLLRNYGLIRNASSRQCQSRFVLAAALFEF